jgi:REP element-mobilizing transposase RayT
VILGYHVIFSAYGFWLPNDPRGSWSEFVGSWELFRFGPATTTDARHSVAHLPHDVNRRREARGALQRPPVHFTGLQARAIGRGFDEFVRKSGLVVWACAILSEHVHLVIGRHTYRVEQMVSLLKGASTRRLLAEGLHPFASGQQPGPHGPVPKCWAQGLWKVYLDTPEDVGRAVRYVEINPLKESKPPQQWRFVTPFVSESAPDPQPV